MSEHFISIDVYPHIKKFAGKMYLRNKQGAFICTETTMLGLFVRMALVDKESWASPDNDQARDRLTATIQVQLTTEQARLSPRLYKLKRVNTLLDRAFKDAMICSILTQKSSGVPILPACKVFLEYYNIDENEYSVDNCYKHWQRWRDRNKPLTETNPQHASV